MPAHEAVVGLEDREQREREAVGVELEASHEAFTHSRGRPLRCLRPPWVGLAPHVGQKVSQTPRDRHLPPRRLEALDPHRHVRPMHQDRVGPDVCQALRPCAPFVLGVAGELSEDVHDRHHRAVPSSS